MEVRHMCNTEETMNTAPSEPRRPKVLLIAIASFTAYGFGMGFLMNRFVQVVDAKGGDAVGMAISDDEASDARLREALINIKFDIISFGRQVRESGAWADRISAWIAESASKDAIMALPMSPEDSLVQVERAIEQFKRQQEGN